MTQIKTRWLVVAAVAPLILSPMCFAIGLNTRPEEIAFLRAGILLGFAGTGALCILSVRFGQEALRSLGEGKIARSGLWLVGGIVLVLVALNVAFVTLLLRDYWQ